MRGLRRAVQSFLGQNTLEAALKTTLSDDQVRELKSARRVTTINITSTGDHDNG
jgi:hypothetical protein